MQNQNNLNVPMGQPASLSVTSTSGDGLMVTDSQGAMGSGDAVQVATGNGMQVQSPTKEDLRQELQEMQEFAQNVYSNLKREAREAMEFQNDAFRRTARDYEQ